MADWKVGPSPAEKAGIRDDGFGFFWLALFGGAEDGHLGVDQEFADGSGGGEVEGGFGAGGDYCAEEDRVAGGAGGVERNADDEGSGDAGLK